MTLNEDRTVLLCILLYSSALPCLQTDSAHVTNAGQVCVPARKRVNERYSVSVCVCQKCARPAVWHWAIPGAQPSPNVLEQSGGPSLLCLLHRVCLDLKFR